jgi:4-hydroxy-tetrahydrodipicolinate reductase
VTRLVITGIRGRMGRLLARLANDRDDVRIVAGIARDSSDADDAAALGCERIAAMEDVAAAAADADVIIDFSRADGTAQLLERLRDASDRAFVIGTTGLVDTTHDALARLAARNAVLTAANFSIGVNLLLVLAEQAAAALDAHAWDIEVVEAHHRRKVDAPSGTALALGEAVARGRGVDLRAVRRDGRSGETGERAGGEVGFHAVRGGGTVGEHQLLFLGERERIELRHEALDRALFAEGALHAALWLAGRAPGRYGMREVLGL